MWMWSEHLSISQKFIHQQLSEITDIVLVPSIITLHYRIVQNDAFILDTFQAWPQRKSIITTPDSCLPPFIHSSIQPGQMPEQTGLASPRSLCPDVGSPGDPRPAGNPPRSSPGPPLWGTCLGNLGTELSRSHPEQMSESSGSSCW